eukprot:1138157-Pelagomonas_calceolata.AAC.2
MRLIRIRQWPAVPSDSPASGLIDCFKSPSRLPKLKGLLDRRCMVSVGKQVAAGSQVPKL